MENNKLTHGLLVENFKQSIINFINSNTLDIQTKAIILDSINTQVQRLSEQQTQKELEEFNEEKKRIEQETQQKLNEDNNEEVS